LNDRIRKSNNLKNLLKKKNSNKKNRD
jgi:hypothetical protein